MADFEVALKVILKNEGGDVDHKNDKGGATSFGISKRFLLSIGIEKEPANLNFDEICELYKDHFWRFDKIRSQEVATKLFDMSVNFGLAKSIQLLEIETEFQTIQLLSQCPPIFTNQRGI